MSANNLQNESQFEFIINAIKEIRNNNKRQDNQTIFDHVTKTVTANMDHSQIDELISSMLKSRLIFGKSSSKVHNILLWRQQITIKKTQALILETTIALLDVVTFHHHMKILVAQPRNLKLLQISLHHK